jgi:uncharacterized damage-inducible protein DinB
MTLAVQTGAVQAKVSSPVMALCGLLRDLSEVLAVLPADMYVARPAARVSGSVGQHVRHCLDHVSALVAARADAPLTYDHRERDTPVETDPAVARARIAELLSRLDVWARRPLNTPLRVSSRLSPSDTLTGWSTLARELAFVVSHTIHHHATIAVLLDIHAFPVPGGFGYAPSTPRAS